MVSAQQLRDRVLSEPALVIYFKNDNCAPCLVLRPKVKKLIDEFFPNIEMIIVDSVEQPQKSYRFLLDNPVFQCFHNE